MAEYRIKVIGAGGVGKSALTIKFIQNTFVEKYDPTIEDSYRKQIDVDESAVMLDITDTAGQEEYAQMRDELLEDGHGFIIVYSITDPASFEEVAGLYEAILKTKNKSDGVPCILAGNKVDMEESRAVPTEHGEEQAKKMGKYCKFFETSAKADPSINVKEIFEELVRLINQKESGAAENGDANKETPQDATAKTEVVENAPDAAKSEASGKKKKKKKPCSIL